MKKFLALICMLTCIFGLSACGSEEKLTEYEQWKVDYTQQLAAEAVVPLLAGFMDDESASSFDEYTAEEIEYLVENQAMLSVDGNAFRSAVESFHSAADSVGNILNIGETTAKIDDDQIIVEVKVTGTKKDAVAEVILSNDMFMKLESAALNPVSSMGELMVGAALNTVIGMGTVFVVLVLISGIISCFSIIPKLQKNAADKKAAKAGSNEEVKAVAVPAPVVQEPEDRSDDLELAAVIAAAIAAYEGSASTDGFVVRSIRRHR